MKGTIGLPILAAIAAGAVVATRLPNERPVLGTAVAACAIVMLACSALRQRFPRAAGLGLTAAGAAAFLVPPSGQAWAHGLPPVVPALALLVFFDVAHEHPEAAAPWSGDRPARPHRLVAYAPLAVLLLLLIALPKALRRVLPDRITASLELDGAFGPVAVSLVLIVPLLCLAWVRDAWTRPIAPREPDETEESQ